jgi:hypothetical protein
MTKLWNVSEPPAAEQHSEHEQHSAPSGEAGEHSMPARCVPRTE